MMHIYVSVSNFCSNFQTVKQRTIKTIANLWGTIQHFYLSWKLLKHVIKYLQHFTDSQIT